jgi:hypothetical protein
MLEQLEKLKVTGKLGIRLGFCAARLQYTYPNKVIVTESSITFGEPHDEIIFYITEHDCKVEVNCGTRVIKGLFPIQYINTLFNSYQARRLDSLEEFLNKTL